MKLLSTLTVAALLTAGAAFAASSTPTATPGSAAPAGAAAAHAVKHSAMHCQKEAKARKLAGDDEKKFVKECREGKTS